ncbi:hypothetical protein BJ166DRAFT_589390 [Pestalotiopsis sp. NC0098]|nr:hypothetical protein BJ166DRAFT_589390 [Pestalotiopsis sp. NC0098]
MVIIVENKEHSRVSDSVPPAFRETKMLLFHLFGTVLEWIKPIHDELYNQMAERAFSRPGAKSFVTNENMFKFAQQWSDSHKRFIESLGADVQLKNKEDAIDAHHYETLVELFEAWGFRDEFPEARLREMSSAWSRLSPQADAAGGLAVLDQHFGLAAVSGNPELIDDLRVSAGRGYFRRPVAPWELGAYRPSPSACLEAAAGGNFEPGECALVSARLADLATARKLGFRTIYVSRSGEEDLSEDEEEQARQWVDRKEVFWKSLAGWELKRTVYDSIKPDYL